jgi:hypothetical protein
MDLISLKEQFKIKQNQAIIILLVLSFITMISSIIYYITNDTDSSETLMAITITIFSFVFSFWLIWYLLKYEKKSKEQIQYVYRRLIATHNMNTNQAYQVLSIQDIPKDYLKKFPLFRFTYPKFSLFLKNQSNQHQLYFVSFYQSTGSSSYTKSSGLLYAYPISTLIKPEDIIKKINLKNLKYPLKSVQYRDQYMIYFEIKKQIPIFKRFNEQEREKVFKFASDVFKFFDSIAAFFE